MAGRNNLVQCFLDSMARAKRIFKSLIKNQKSPYIAAFSNLECEVYVIQEMLMNVHK